MTTTALDSWSDFKEAVAKVIEKTKARRLAIKLHVSSPLYRGHADESWKLETTLERAGHHLMPVATYYGNVRSAHRYLANFGAQPFTLEKHSEITWDSIAVSLPDYEYLANLRHHGFPSPLLDWTQSPYVAAFFAFALSAQTSDRVAVYVYHEDWGDGKSSSSQIGTIRVQGPWASIHERHVLQQSWYSFSVKNLVSTINGKFTEPLVFSPHEEAFDSPYQLVGYQDLLEKFTIPRTERLVALRDLLQMNITPYSLFHSEDALVATVGMKIFDKLDD